MKIIRSNFKKLRFKLVGRLPLSYRRKMYLSRCDILNRTGAMDRIKISVAHTVEEFTAAFQLVHAAYVESGYIDPSPHKLRVRPYDLLPTTAVFIAKVETQVVATMSAIIDSEMGLPIEKAFPDELQSRRALGGKIAEVSGLAVKKEFRTAGLVTHMARAVDRYVVESGCTESCIAVSPSIGCFYRDLFFYENLGGTRSYSSEKYDPVIALRRDCFGMMRRMEKAYTRCRPELNLYVFFAI